MINNQVILKEIVLFHYGSALKSEDRDETGTFDVFGSNGPVGRHTERLISHPTIIIGRKGSVGSLYYAQDGGWPIDTTYYTEILDPKRLHLRYLFYALSQAGLNRHTIVTSIPGLNRDALYRTQIPLPPLPEQRRIADILDKADAIRRKRREEIEFCVSLRSASFNDMFGDLVKVKSRPLAEIAHVVSGVTKGRKLERKTETVPYLRVANVQDGFLDLGELKTIEATPDEIEHLALRPGDIVMTEGGDFDKLGRGAIWNQDLYPCIHQNHVFRVRLKQDVVLPEFFATFLRSKSAKGYFLKCAKKTTNLASINMTQLRELPVPLPPVRDQLRFQSMEAKIRELNDSIERSHTESGHLFESLVSTAFSAGLSIQ